MSDRIAEGEAHFSAGRLDDAERCFEEEAQAGERKGEALNNLGVLAYQRGDAAKAADSFVRALALDEMDTSASKTSARSSPHWVSFTKRNPSCRNRRSASRLTISFASYWLRRHARRLL